MESMKAVMRITAIWAITECGLGGFFHAIKTPFTGLIVGGLAVVYISLIAYNSQNKTKDLAKALLFVLVVKLAVSPHSPLGAYLAVSMQAGFGMLFFGFLPSHKIATILTAVASMISSAIQKIIILTILFGTSLWVAIDQFLEQVVAKMDFFTIPGDMSVSFWLMSIYVGIYTIGGFVIGFVAANIPGVLQSESDDLERRCSKFQFEDSAIAVSRRKKGSILIVVFFACITFFVFIAEYYYISSEAAIHQLVRTLVIVTVWFLLINPLVKYLLGNFLRNRQHTYEDEMDSIRQLIPKMRSFAVFAWKESSGMKGQWRLLNFIHLLIFYGIYKA